MRPPSIAAHAFVVFLLVALCGESPPGPVSANLGLPHNREIVAPGGSPAPSRAEPTDGGADAESHDAEGHDAESRDAETESDGANDADAAPAVGEGPCPSDMEHVATRFCPDVERKCTDVEREKINHLTICHAFAKEQRCRVPERPLDFCIDRYEYPNRKGAHPTWMVDWYQAQATCESKGKRLCWASEWTAACEGPDHSPFPYGWERNHDKCNMDNFFIDPKKFPGPKGQFLFYAKDPTIRANELARLDESVASGSMESCRSGFGVYDMPGNLDEWVVSDEPPREISKWAGLKGGAWGHVRSQCRPMTTSHDPGFAYYFVGFRCCKDVPGAPEWTPSPRAVPAPMVAPRDAAPEEVIVSNAPGPSKTKWSRNGKSE